LLKEKEEEEEEEEEELSSFFEKGTTGVPVLEYLVLGVSGS
jgi:hypothetical protein